MLKSISIYDNAEAYFHFDSDGSSFLSVPAKVIGDQSAPWLAETQPGQLEAIIEGFGIDFSNLPSNTYGNHKNGDERFTIPAKYLSACLSLSQPDELPYEIFLDDWEKAFEPITPSKALEGVETALGKYAYPVSYKVPEYYEGHVWSLIASYQEHTGHLCFDLKPELSDRAIGIIVTSRPLPAGAAKNRPFVKLVQRL